MKIFLFDVDGVLIRSNPYFGMFLEQNGYSNVVEAIEAYYKSPEEKGCLEGKNDPHIIIQPYLEQFGWKGDAKQFFEQNYLYVKQFLDGDLLAKIALLRSIGVKCFLATDQDYRRKDFLLDELSFRHLFDGWFISSELGASKGQEIFWDKTLDFIQENYPGVLPADILFIDDRESNLVMAQKRKIKTFHLKDEATMMNLKIELDKLIRSQE